MILGLAGANGQHLDAGSSFKVAQLQYLKMRYDVGSDRRPFSFTERAPWRKSHTNEAERAGTSLIFRIVRLIDRRRLTVCSLSVGQQPQHSPCSW